MPGLRLLCAVMWALPGVVLNAAVPVHFTGFQDKSLNGGLSLGKGLPNGN